MRPFHSDAIHTSQKHLLVLVLQAIALVLSRDNGDQKIHLKGNLIKWYATIFYSMVHAVMVDKICQNIFVNITI